MSATYTHVSLGHRLVLGPGAARALRGELDLLGARRALVVCSPRAAASASLRRVIDEAGLPASSIFAGIAMHAPHSAVRRGWEHARALAPDAIVAFGGGSAMDSARGIALAIAEQGRVMEFAVERLPDGSLRGTPSTAPKLPLVAIPTTVSGAEITPGFAVTDDSGRKRLFRDAQLAARVILMDSELLAEVPVKELAASTMNALAHAFEALYSTARTPLAALAARAAFGPLRDGLAGALARPHADLAACTALAQGAYYAGSAIVNARTALHHAICHKLAPAAGLSHGLANSIMLPHALAFNAVAARAEIATAAEALGVAPPGTSDAERCQAAIDEVRRLAATAGLPARLRDAGVRAEALAGLPELIEREPGLAFNPRRDITATQIRGVLEAAW